MGILTKEEPVSQPNSNELRWLDFVLEGQILATDAVAVHQMTRAELATRKIGDDSLYRVGTIFDKKVESRDICPSLDKLLAHVIFSLSADSDRVCVLVRMTYLPLEIGRQRLLEIIRPPKPFDWIEAATWVKEKEKDSFFDPVARRYRLKPLAQVLPMSPRREKERKHRSAASS